MIVKIEIIITTITITKQIRILQGLSFECYTVHGENSLIAVPLTAITITDTSLSSPPGGPVNIKHIATVAFESDTVISSATTENLAGSKIIQNQSHL